MDREVPDFEAQRQVRSHQERLDVLVYGFDADQEFYIG